MLYVTISTLPNLKRLHPEPNSLTLYDANTDPFDPNPDYVRVLDTHMGKGVFAVRGYPAKAMIGEITGELAFHSSQCDEYTFGFDEELQLQPDEPFRFVNHSCNPNCEFEPCELPETDEQPGRTGLFIFTLRDIQPDEPLSIDYNWPASCAIPCLCQEPDCRGWVVAIEELPLVKKKMAASAP